MSNLPWRHFSKFQFTERHYVLRYVIQQRHLRHNKKTRKEINVSFEIYFE